MGARERMRRYRERIRAGRRRVTTEHNDLALGRMLAETGDVDPMRDDDPEELRNRLQRLLDRLLDRYA